MAATTKLTKLSCTVIVNESFAPLVLKIILEDHREKKKKKNRHLRFVFVGGAPSNSIQIRHCVVHDPPPPPTPPLSLQ